MVFLLAFTQSKKSWRTWVSRGRWLLWMKNWWWSPCGAYINNTIIIQIKVVSTCSAEQLWAQWCTNSPKAGVSVQLMPALQQQTIWKRPTPFRILPEPSGWEISKQEREELGMKRGWNAESWLKQESSLLAFRVSRDNHLELFPYSFWLKIRLGKFNLFVVFILLNCFGAFFEHYDN